MACGEWRGLPERLELGELWGITDPAVRRYASEAHHIFELDPEELKQLREEHAAFCDRIKHEAVGHRSAITGLPDYASALKAVEMAAKFQGIDLEPRPQFVSAESRRIEIRVLAEDAAEKT